MAPFSPIYVAGYLQDKFTYKDIIFRVGGRVDYYDANTKVLSDPYSLYGILGANAFHSQVGTTKPNTIGDDYKVYLVGEGSSQVKAYRNGDQWYFANGTAANNSLAIFGDNNLVAPAYIQPEDTLRSIRGKFLALISLLKIISHRLIGCQGLRFHSLFLMQPTSLPITM